LLELVKFSVLFKLGKGNKSVQERKGALSCPSPSKDALLNKEVCACLIGDLLYIF